MTKVRKIINCAVICIIAALILTLTACTEAVTERSRTVRVTLVLSEYFTLASNESASTVTKRGQTVQFRILPVTGYYVTDTDYHDYEKREEDGITVLTINQPKYSVRIKVNCKKIINNAIV